MKSQSSMTLSVFTATFAVLWGGHPAFADHNAQNPAITDVLVTAPEIGSSLGGAVLDSADLNSKRAASSDTTKLLNGLPGVHSAGASGVSTLPVVRGLADDRLRIKVDGMDLVSACANHMNPPLSYVDPNNIETIEVLTGITPVSVGGDSIGSTIIVESSSPRFADETGAWINHLEMGTFYRSNGDSQGINISAGAATRRLSLRYSGAFARADNYESGGDFKAAGAAAVNRHWLDGDEVGSTGYETQNHKLGVALQQKNHLFGINLGYQHIPYQGFPNQRMDMLDNTSYQIALSHAGDFNWGRLESRVYREETEHAMNFGPDKQFWYGNAPGMPMETEGQNTGAAITASYDFPEGGQVQVGGEVQQYGLNDWWPPSGSGMMMAPNTFWNIRNGERDRYALFGEWQVLWNERWVTVVGTRYESVQSDADDVQGYSMMYATNAASFNSKPHKKSDDNWDFSAQARYTPSRTQTYQFGIARKSRSPNLYERYTWSTMGMAMRMVNLVGDGNGYVGNLELEPEVAHTISVSADWHDPQQQHWKLVVSPYFTWVDDFIDATPCMAMMCQMSNASPGFRYLTFTNDDARIYGVDMQASRHLFSMDSVGNVSVGGVLSYVDGKNETTGDNLYNIMPLTVTFSLTQSSGHWRNSVEWQLVSAKEQISAVRNEVETAGYALLNLHSSYTLGKVRVDLGMENALDKNYDLPLGGAYVGQGATMGGANVPWGIAVPGPGRSAYLGVNYSF